MKPYFSIFFLFLASLVLLPNAQAQSKQPLKFATEATYPPFVYMGPSGKIKGFGAAIVHALCQKMKTQCVTVNQPWDSLIPSLKLGKYDALFGGMDITPAREQQVDFTHSYYKNSAGFVASKAAHLVVSKSGLKGKTIGVQGGTTFDTYLQKVYGSDVTINRYPSEQDAFLDLASGRVDAVMGDTPLLKAWIAKNSKQYAMINQLNSVKYFGAGHGIAVKKGNKKLQNALNKALVGIKADGTYSKIVSKYFGQNG